MGSIRTLFAKVTNERRQCWEAGDNNSKIILHHGPHNKLGTVDIVCERFNGENSNDLDGCYESSEGEDAEEDDFLS